MGRTTGISRLPTMEHMPVAGRLNCRRRGIFTSMLLPWTRKAHSREVLQLSPIGNIWKGRSWAGRQARWANNTGISAWACGETRPRAAGVDTGAVVGSSMSFLAAGHPSDDLASVPVREPRSKMFTEWGWLGFAHSDARETCLGLHSTTANRAPARARNIMRALLRRFTAFA